MGAIAAEKGMTIGQRRTHLFVWIVVPIAAAAVLMAAMAGKRRPAPQETPAEAREARP